MIPQELVDKIVWEVGNDSDDMERQSTLQACSLTSWSFLVPTRKILFQRIHLQEELDVYGYPQGTRSDVQEFGNIIQHNPSLERNITSLTIKLTFLRASRCRTRQLEIKEKQFPGLPSILSSLFNVQSFSLGLDIFSGRIISSSWDHINVSLQESLLNFYASKSITHLDINFLQNIPVNLVFDCPRLTSLSLSGVSFAENKPSCWPCSQRVSRVKFFSIDGGCLATSSCLKNYIKHAKTRFQLSDLQALEVKATIFQRFPDFNIYTPSVTRLFVDCGSCDHPTPKIKFPLNGWQNLQVLQFNCIFFKDRTFRRLPLFNPATFGYSSSFSEGGWPASIHTFILKVEWAHLESVDEMVPFDPSLGWAGIDRTFSSLTFQNLRTFKLDLNLCYLPNPSTRNKARSIQDYILENVRERLPLLLPSLSASTRIKVELGITVTISEDNRW